MENKHHVPNHQPVVVLLFAGTDFSVLDHTVQPYQKSPIPPNFDWESLLCGPFGTPQVRHTLRLLSGKPIGQHHFRINWRFTQKYTKSTWFHCQTGDSYGFLSSVRSHISLPNIPSFATRPRRRGFLVLAL